MSAEGRVGQRSARDGRSPSMDALLAAGEAARAVCTPPPAPEPLVEADEYGERGEREQRRSEPGQRDAA